MIVVGDARDLPLRDAVVQCVVCSPPYWGLRDYGTAPLVWGGDPACEHEWGEIARTPWANSVPGPNGNVKNTEAGHWKTKEHGQWCRCLAWRGSLGLEPTPELYVEHLVQAFREVWRVLRDDGTLWLNLGDSYASAPPGNTTVGVSARSTLHGVNGPSAAYRETLSRSVQTKRNTIAPGLKPKDLVGVPWRVAFALQADGWYLRSDIIWAKGVSFCPEYSGTVMPESVRDRPTRAHENLFLLTKSETYFYDYDAVRERAVSAHEIQWDPGTDGHAGGKSHAGSGVSTRRFAAGSSGNKERKLDVPTRPNNHLGSSIPWEGVTRNLRSVWAISPKPYPEAHFATFPTDLVKPCVMAGSRAGDLVLDPFAGSGTTVYVAKELGRRAIGVDLKPEYCQLALKRTRQGVLPL